MLSFISVSERDGKGNKDLEWQKEKRRVEIVRDKPRDNKGWFFLFMLVHEAWVLSRVAGFLPTRTTHYNVTSMYEVRIVIRKD